MFFVANGIQINLSGQCVIKMISTSALLWLFLLLPTTSNADWVDKLAAAIDGYDKLTSMYQSHSSLVADDAARHGLPEHWQAYWLHEPVFGTRIFLAEAGKPDAPVVFMVHGLGQNGMQDWINIVPALEQHYRVLLIDLPGFANSPPPNKKLSPTRYADLLHFVKPHFSAEPVATVGHSMGGAVAMRYAHRYPEDVSQLALLDVAGILQRTAFIKHIATGRIPIDRQMMSGPLLDYVIGLQDYGNVLIENIVNLPDPTVWLGKSDYAWGATLGRYPNINAALGLIEENFSSAIYEQEKPVSILWGGEDVVAPPRTGHAMVQNLQRGSLLVIPKAGHVPMASHPNEVSTWLLQSLRTAPDRKQSKIAKRHEGQTDYECKNQFGGIVSGAYSRVVIEKCIGLVLENVTAGEIIVRDSHVEFENTEMLNTGTALKIYHSTVVMTAGRVHGLVVVSKSRVDFAGVELDQIKPFNVGEESRLVLSVSRAGKNHYLHADLVLVDTQF
jgi:pimeloyl-ACP methyl ester carboxylesterase